jgi:hypothetical protein
LRPSRRCLVVESLPYHWELLPPWVTMLQELGYEVEVAAPGGIVGHQETLRLLQSRCRTHRVADIHTLSLDSFDFILLNSLVHDGYFFAEPLDQRPNLKWLRELGRPSISVVHEPVNWLEKRIVHSFDEDDGRSSKVLNLLADGRFQRERGFWSEESWSIDGHRLQLPDDGRIRLFETDDGGRSYRGLGADSAATLIRRQVADESLPRHCEDGRHAVIALTERAAAHLAPLSDTVKWILPFEIRERMPERRTGETAFAGIIDYDRKAMHSLARAAEALSSDEFILMIGGSRNTEEFLASGFIKYFREQTGERGLESRFRFTGYLPYGAFVEKIRTCRFLLPLVDDYVDGGSYALKLPAAIPYALGLGIPLIVNQAIAERFGLQYMICYPGDDLASGLRAMQRLDDRGYSAMLETLDRHAETLYRRNIGVLADLIEQITAAGAAT